MEEDKEKEARLAVVLQLPGREAERGGSRQGERALLGAGVAGGRHSGGGGRRRSSLRKSEGDAAIKKVVKGREGERVEWSNQVGWRDGGREG